jgi:hypothetical protein
MTDLYAGVAIVVSFSIFLALLAYRFARDPRRRAAGVAVAVVAAAVLVANVVYWRDSLWPARLLPFSNVIVLADLSIPLAAILIGAGAALMPGSPWRRSVLLLPLAVLGSWSTLTTLAAQAPITRDHWTAGVCRQTTSATCSPAAGATLLAAVGIPTTEAEMAHLCLTTLQGTSSRGLYRALKLKTAGTGYDVRVFHGDLPALRAALADGPLVLTVKLVPVPGTDPRFQREWGWAPGVSHSVVVFGTLLDALYDVGDPSVGREPWDRRALDTLWHGEALQVVRRK